MCPSIDNLVITLVVGNETHIIVSHDLLNLLISLLNQRVFFSRNKHIGQVERQTTLKCHIVTQVLDIIQELSGTSYATSLDYPTDDVAKRLLTQHLVYITNLFRHELVDHQTSNRSLNHRLHQVTVRIQILHVNMDRSMDIQLLLIVSDRSLFRTIESQTFALCTLAQLGNIIQTKHHILRRYGNRSTIRRVQDIV